MSETVNVYEAKTHLSKLIERVEAGEEIVLARAGKPCARLVPLAPAPPRKRVGLLPGLEIGPEFFEPLPEDEIDAWEGCS
ncbi:MAG: type II toxin-antitoxin system Phd/YefM family antitoxin [Acidimicrobiaceae bacterium]|nr:type II toxin-antitoxin system Phd/YefM family antitoxin [Acidimicrobiaceae bacterium]MCY4175462.1 type II toxin-antitoxin system Phd/YefM family antitoxin [Acidimicrobiaceae bacterium]MCY4280499.1 type II toxin-antitoxin system Phd/YefM family antitoxin [Acidimicrobiaceae bacterium]MCY4295334.1 type II toxin-antitoxin system Phd/YefM family antitoxin [Acidimicrobiaceae bacterium]